MGSFTDIHIQSPTKNIKTSLLIYLPLPHHAIHRTLSVLYPARVIPYGMHGMGGGFHGMGMDSMEWGMDSMEWGMDSILLVDGFHTFSMEWGMDSILF